MRTALQTFAAINIALAIATGAAFAQPVAVDLNRISDCGIGEKIGSATITESKGLSVKVVVTGLAKGAHGFHVHEKGDCGPAMKDGKMAAGMAAGDHFDPGATKSHKGPKGKGHAGDMPVLTATAKGITQTVTAPRLKLSEIEGRSLIIHEGGDTFSDKPESGGGKGRIACGVILKK